MRTHGSAQWIIQRVRISFFPPIPAWVKLKRLAWAVALPCQRLHVWHQDIYFWDELAFYQPHYTPGRKMQDSTDGVGRRTKGDWERWHAGGSVDKSTASRMKRWRMCEYDRNEWIREDTIQTSMCSVTMAYSRNKMKAYNRISSYKMSYICAETLTNMFMVAPAKILVGYCSFCN